MTMQPPDYPDLPYGPVRPPARRRSRWLVIAGVAVVVLATAGVAAVVVFSPDDGQGVVNTAASALPAPSPTPATPSLTPMPSPGTSSSSASDDPSGATGSDPDADGTATPRPGATTHLDEARTLAGYYVSRPVSFSGKRYTRGIAFTCTSATSTYLQWNVAGSVRFTATSGIDDNTPVAFERLTEMIFYDQDGRSLLPKPVEASVGHPQDIVIDLTGVVSLRMTCAARNSRTNQPSSVYAALGDPQIVHG